MAVQSWGALCSVWRSRAPVGLSLSLFLSLKSEARSYAVGKTLCPVWTLWLWKGGSEDRFCPAPLVTDTQLHHKPLDVCGRPDLPAAWTCLKWCQSGDGFTWALVCGVRFGRAFCEDWAAHTSGASPCCGRQGSTCPGHRWNLQAAEFADGCLGTCNTEDRGASTCKLRPRPGDLSHWQQIGGADLGWLLLLRGAWPCGVVPETAVLCFLRLEALPGQQELLCFLAKTERFVNLCCYNTYLYVFMHVTSVRSPARDQP